MALRGLLRPPAAVAGAAGIVSDLTLGAVGALVLGRDRRSRDVWAVPGRLHIETHGVHGPGGDAVARRVERELERHPGVEWARVNAPACRVLVAVREPAPARRELADLVARAETPPADAEEQIAEADLHHPGEPIRRTRLVPHLVVDAAALAVAGVTRLVPWAPLPAELAGLVSGAELHPRVRSLAAHRLHGRERADSALSMSARVAHALAAGGAGAVLDIALRAGQWREVRAEQQAWQRAEPQLVRGPADAAAGPVTGRTAPMPDGPVERYQRRALATGATAAAAAVPVLGPRRAAALGLAGLPKATEAGPAAFASHLGRVISRDGALVMDRAVLRRLSRMDTLVLDAAVLHGDRWALTDLEPVSGTDPAELAERGFALFDPGRPHAVRRDGQWRLGPLDELAVAGRAEVRQRSRLADAGNLLGLARGDQLVALLTAEPEPAPGLDPLVAAARQAGLRIVLATDEPAGAPDPGYADAVVPRSGLVGAVRGSQADGGVVMLVSSDRPALGAADCGIGVRADGAPPPWGAHVIVGSGLTTAGLLVEAVTSARRVDRDSIMLARAASGVGLVSTLADRHPRPAGRSLGTTSGGAALAFGTGVWRAHHLHTRPPAATTARPPWHLMPASVALARLDSTEDGLTSQQVTGRGRADRPPQPVGLNLAAAFLDELANPLTPVLVGGAVVSAVLGSLVDAGLVAGVLGISALTGAVQRTRTDRALAGLLARSAVTATVRRDRADRTLPADQLVPGDVLLLQAGDVVPADCRLLHADGVEVDESSLSGESLPVTKDPAPVAAAELAERRSMLYEGTTLANGSARAVVVATGTETEVGRSMAAARQAAPGPGGVQAHLARLTRRSLPLALGSAAAVSAAGLLHRVPLRRSLHTAATLAISSVPEGLPFLINAAQLSAARRLADRGALVRNPATIEALGRVDVLCFDKTGTLTEGQLSVHEVHDGRHRRPVEKLDDTGRAVMAAALRATPDGSSPDELPHHTDRAVVEAADRAGARPETGAQGWRKLRSLPFESSRGFHATVGETEDGELLSVKGAPEVVLARCGSRRDSRRSARPLDEQARAGLTAMAEQLAGAGHRVLAVAERRRPAASAPDAPDGSDASGIAGWQGDENGGQEVRDLVFLGFLALADPVRISAAPAAAALRDAGVQIVMVTGDHPATAEAIAAAVRPDQRLDVITGAELDELDDHALAGRLAEVDVVARCSPAQKVRIIEAYQRLGKVVAMTGDGANDAPAIRLADVGIALGKRGTPAAQAAADLVVSDDKLETIIAALVEGRAMWSSVRHALGILLGGNLGEIAFTVLGAGLTGRSPLGARQLLLVNLLTDLAPAVAIALRGPDGRGVAQLLHEGPDRSLGGALNRELAVRATATSAGAGAAWLAARLTGRRRRAGTVALAALVGTQLGQTMLTGGLDRNVLVAGLGSAAVLTGVIQTPGVSGFFGCTPLGPIGWSIAAGGAAAGTVLGTVLIRLPERAPQP